MTADIAPRGRRWWLPPGASPDASWLIAARGSRAFADGLVSVLLPTYLLDRGFDAFTVGILSTLTLLGSAALTLGVGAVTNRIGYRPLLLTSCVLMAGTGVGFATLERFWPLAIVAFVGTLNPSAGDVSLFLPLEQSLLTQMVGPRGRTALFARYSLFGTMAGALGTLSAGLPILIARTLAYPLRGVLEAAFLLYAVLAGLALLCYRRLGVGSTPTVGPRAAPLGDSRGIVIRLAALFSLDAFGGGFFVQSLLVVWLHQRFDISVSVIGMILFIGNSLSAISFLVAVPLSRRFGLINTMVFTHLPSNVLLMLVPFAPTLGLAVILLLARYALSQMDVPTRASYVMAVVPPEARAAAASVTAVPRGLAAAISPMLAGYLLVRSVFGWPLIIGGLLKALYDVLLLLNFRSLPAPEERRSQDLDGAARRRPPDHRRVSRNDRER
jgi:MFS family permease